MSLKHIIAVVAAFSASPSLAEELPYSWTGFYAGVNTGYHWGGGDFGFVGMDTSDPGLGGALLTGQFTHEGVDAPDAGLIGGQVGYNYQADDFVLGVEADIAWMRGRSSSLYFKDVDKRRPATQATERSLDYFGTLRARLGYTPINRLLVYVTGGLAYGNAKSSFKLDGPEWSPILDITSSGTAKRGGTFGGGVEYAFADRWTIKGEYLYYNLGKTSSTATYVYSGVEVSSLKVTAKNTGQILRMGVNYKF